MSVAKVVGGFDIYIYISFELWTGLGTIFLLTIVGAVHCHSVRTALEIPVVFTFMYGPCDCVVLGLPWWWCLHFGAGGSILRV
jgi:hypothetical protein